VLQESLVLELDDALSLATERWLTLMGSEQRVEGHKAFIEKRAPTWGPA
jgi:1,4-dihydroxy-2-naphthoyl-CoA synthase